tara:strand:- start:312 stop:416 length:105 start_codon:yes stop_codon:yes gene_type:complete
MSKSYGLEKLIAYARAFGDYGVSPARPFKDLIAL